MLPAGSSRHRGRCPLAKPSAFALWIAISLNCAAFAQKRDILTAHDVFQAGGGTRQQEKPTREQEALRRGSRRHLGRSRLIVVEISDRWVAALSDRSFRRQSPVNLSVMGARVIGMATTSGRYAIHCFEADQGVACYAQVEGTSVSFTTARKGPAFIYTQATTGFTATTHVFLQERTLIAGNTSVNAAAGSQESRVDTRFRLGRRLVRWVARRRMRQNHAEIDAIAEQEAEDRIEAVINEAVEKFRTRMNGHLTRLGAQFPWLGWGEHQTLVHLATMRGGLRFSVASGGGQMVDPLLIAVGGPKGGTRIHLDNHALQTLPPRLRQRLRRLVGMAALVSSLRRREISLLPWSVELLESDRGMQTRLRGPGFMIQTPLRSDLLLLLLKRMQGDVDSPVTPDRPGVQKSFSSLRP